MVEWMLILAGGVNRLVEFLKLGVIASLQTRWKFGDDVYQALLLFLSLALGIFAAVVGNANALALVPENPYTGRIPEAAGIIAAGLLIGLGTNVIHEIGEFFAILKRPSPPPVESTAVLVSSTTVGVQPDSGAAVRAAQSQDYGDWTPPAPPPYSAG